MDKNFTFLEGSLAPLKRYLSASLTSHPTEKDPHRPLSLRNGGGTTYSRTRDDHLRDDGLFDWGLDDDYRDTSSPTLVNDYTSSEMDLSADTPIVEQHVFSDWGVSPTKDRQHARIGLQASVSTRKLPVRRRSLGQVFQILMKKQRLMTEESSAFLDEFKYVLVTSQLLDETILVSRFYNKKKSSSLSIKSTEKRGVITDFGRIIKVNTTFRINPTIPTYNVVRIVQILIYMNHSKHSHSLKQLNIATSLLLIVLWLHIRSKNLRLSITQTTLLAKLKNFIKRYQKFDTIIQRLVNKHKEITLYTNITPQTPQTPQTPTTPSTPTTLEKSVDPDALYEIINSTVFLSTQGLIKALKTIIPLVNSNELENYCGIYNVNISELAFMIDDPKLSDMKTSENLVHCVKRFQFIRRFFICTLLAFNLENSDCTPFMNTVCKVFGVVGVHESVSVKWETITIVLAELQSLNGTLFESMKNFVALKNLNLGAFPIHQDSSSRTSQQSDPTASLKRELKQLQLDLLSFDNDKSPEDQLVEFKNIGKVLESLNQTYQNGLSFLENSTNRRQFHLTKHRSVSARTSKRSSTPQGQPHLNLISPPRSFSSSPSLTQHHKRLSSGLTLPLLTVLEDDSSIPISESDYVIDKNLLSNDDSVVISLNTDDAFEGMTSEELKKKLETNFERFTSTSTTIEQMRDVVGTDEKSTNDDKVSEEDGAPLMDELKKALTNRQ